MSVFYTVAPMMLQLSSASEPLPKMKLVDYNGVSLYAEQLKDNQYRIVQICTSNLNDYLRDDIQPGTIISC